MTHAPSLLVYVGRTGDRNPRAMAGSAVLGDALSQRLATPKTVLGNPLPPLGAAWDGELAAARPGLLELAATVERTLGGRSSLGPQSSAGTRPSPDERSSLAARPTLIAVIGRCAAALATLPVIARHHPEACVVWFDAHADCNTPTSVPNPYLGGMPISAAAGLWDSGLGSGLSLANVVLVGSRDIDPDERELIATGAPRLVPPGPDLAARLNEAVGGRPVYIHLDCDVLEPGIVPTEYVSPGGLSLEDLRAAMQVLSRKDPIGLEVAEYEATWAQDNRPASPEGLLLALDPMLDRLARAGH